MSAAVLDRPADSAAAIRLSRRMLLLAALCQNVAMGLMFGSFGTFVVAIEEAMRVDRGLSTLGVALTILAIGLISPFIGLLMRRFGLRALLMAGASLCALGYAGAAAAADIAWLLACYALLVGPGIALLGLAVPSALVANWFVEGRGRAIGIVNMPILVALLPPVVATVTLTVGLGGAYLILASGAALLVPVLSFVIDRPEDVGLAPRGRGEAIVGEMLDPMGAVSLLRTRDYVLLAVTAAIIAGGGATISTHVMPLAVGQGVPPSLAALLISLLGFAGIMGSFGYGALADRIGGGRALSLNAGVQALLWLGLLVPMPFSLRALLIAAIGINSGGIIAAIATALSQRFGTASLGGALGLWSLMNLPFTVALPPLAGALFAWTGGYVLPFTFQIGLFSLAALLPWFGSLRLRAGRVAPTRAQAGEASQDAGAG